MPEHVRLTIGDRTLVLLPSTCIEQWTDEGARWRLQEIAQQWPGRDALLRMSDDTLGPDDDIGAAIEHLARALDRGWLIAVRLPDAHAQAGSGSGQAHWDAPRLADLGDGDGGRGAATDARDARVPRPARPSSPGATTPTLPGASADRPTDTWTTFVAFVVVDQDGKPLGGESRCTIAGATHVHALGEAAIEIEPIGAHARVMLELAELATKTEAPA